MCTNREEEEEKKRNTLCFACAEPCSVVQVTCVIESQGWADEEGLERLNRRLPLRLFANAPAKRQVLGGFFKREGSCRLYFSDIAMSQIS